MIISKKQILKSNLQSKTSFKRKTFNQTEPFQNNKLGNCLRYFSFLLSLTIQHIHLKKCHSIIGIFPALFISTRKQRPHIFVKYGLVLLTK